MPFRREIDHDERVVRSICEGVITSDQIQVDQRAFWSQGWLTGFGEIFDMRAATFSGSREGRYAAVVASDERTAVVPVALVYSGDDEVQSTIARRYVDNRLAIDDQAKCRAFEDVHAAEAWLLQQL